MEQNKPVQPSQENDKQSDEWIKEVASRSYEPELLVSGAGIYLSYNLPFLIDWIFDYYIQNLLSDADSVDAVLPILIYGFLKSNAYVLVFTFLFHFTMRAFWVGIVGLHSVFPEGIIYENLGKQYNELYKAKAKEKLGTTESFIVRLDRTCSIIFSGAFMLVIIFVGICFVYCVLILLLNAIHLILGNAKFKELEMYLYFGILGLFVLPALVGGVLGLNQFKKNPKMQQIQANLMWNYSTMMYPMIGLTLMRISFIFRSNTASKSKQIFSTILGMMVVLVLFVFTVLEKSRGEVFDSRYFYGVETQVDEVISARYDNLREKGKIIKTVSIQSDVIEDNYIKLFINYPKKLDKEIQKICPKPKIDAKLDNLDKQLFLDNYHLECLHQYFKVYLNDSLIKKPAFVFLKNPNAGEKGLQSYISTENCQKGKNLLQVEYIITRRSKPDTIKHIIPFWYAQKKQNTD